MAGEKAGTGARRLGPEELRWVCPADLFRFETTAELDPLKGTIGQGRALEALRMGLSLYAPGFNVFVCGIRGTHGMETVRGVLGELQPQCRLAQDRAYVYNFARPDEPILLEFPPGSGRMFARAMTALVDGNDAELVRQR